MPTKQIVLLSRDPDAKERIFDLIDLIGVDLKIWVPPKQIEDDNWQFSVFKNIDPALLPDSFKSKEGVFIIYEKNVGETIYEKFEYYKGLMKSLSEGKQVVHYICEADEQQEVRNLFAVMRIEIELHVINPNDPRKSVKDAFMLMGKQIVQQFKQLAALSALEEEKRALEAEQKQAAQISNEIMQMIAHPTILLSPENLRMLDDCYVREPGEKVDGYLKALKQNIMYSITAKLEVLRTEAAFVMLDKILDAKGVTYQLLSESHDPSSLAVTNEILTLMEQRRGLKGRFIQEIKRVLELLPTTEAKIAFLTNRVLVKTGTTYKILNVHRGSGSGETHTISKMHNSLEKLKKKQTAEEKNALPSHTQLMEFLSEPQVVHYICEADEAESVRERMAADGLEVRLYMISANEKERRGSIQKALTSMNEAVGQQSQRLIALLSKLQQEKEALEAEEGPAAALKIKNAVMQMIAHPTIPLNPDSLKKFENYFANKPPAEATVALKALKEGIMYQVNVLIRELHAEGAFVVLEEMLDQESSTYLLLNKEIDVSSSEETQEIVYLRQQQEDLKGKRIQEIEDRLDILAKEEHEGSSEEQEIVLRILSQMEFLEKEVLNKAGTTYKMLNREIRTPSGEAEAEIVLSMQNKLKALRLELRTQVALSQLREREEEERSRRVLIPPIATGTEEKNDALPSGIGGPVIANVPASASAPAPAPVLVSSLPVHLLVQSIRQVWKNGGRLLSTPTEKVLSRLERGARPPSHMGQG